MTSTRMEPVAAIDLGDGLTLRPVRDERDAVRYIALSAAINGEHEGVMCTRLLRHHPDTSRADFMLVEDEHTHEVVSTTCLIPWRLNYAGVPLETAMLEMVVTHPAYRKRGLVRAQIQHFHQTVRARGFDLSIIQGIPHYYRQFGYAYALDHQPYDSLPTWRIPPAADESTYHLRAATLDDVPTLTALYHRALANHALYTQRSPAYWHFLLQAAHNPVRVIVDAHDHSVAGYAITFAQPGSEVVVSESAILNHDAGMALLSQLKTEASGDIQLGGSPTNALVQLGRSLGSTPLVCDQWLLRVTDVAAFLTRIAPALEQRVAASDCAGLNATLTVNLFRSAFSLRFTRGKLSGIDELGFVDASMGADGGDLCIPPDAFVRLLFGYRSLDQLRDAWPDIIVKPQRRHILDVLFPRMTSCVWMPY